MAHICTVSLACHVEVNFTLVSMGDDVTHSRSISHYCKPGNFCVMKLSYCQEHYNGERIELSPSTMVLLITCIL